jgi:hypothetical protein
MGHLLGYARVSTVDQELALQQGREDGGGLPADAGCCVGRELDVSPSVSLLGVSAGRPNETMHRLADWTGPQWQSEQLAAQILHAEGYQGIDPTHPYGGPDGRADAITAQ